MSVAWLLVIIIYFMFSRTHTQRPQELLTDSMWCITVLLTVSRIAGLCEICSPLRHPGSWAEFPLEFQHGDYHGSPRENLMHWSDASIEVCVCLGVCVNAQRWIEVIFARSLFIVRFLRPWHSSHSGRSNPKPFEESQTDVLLHTLPELKLTQELLPRCQGMSLCLLNHHGSYVYLYLISNGTMHSHLHEHYCVIVVTIRKVGFYI